MVAEEAVEREAEEEFLDQVVGVAARPNDRHRLAALLQPDQPAVEAARCLAEAVQAEAALEQAALDGQVEGQEQEQAAALVARARATVALVDRARAVVEQVCQAQGQAAQVVRELAAVE